MECVHVATTDVSYLWNYGLAYVSTCLRVLFALSHNYYFAGVTIGFEMIVYSATEGVDASVELCAVLVAGTLEREAVVMFSTSDGSATSGGWDYCIFTVLGLSLLRREGCLTQMGEMSCLESHEYQLIYLDEYCSHINNLMSRSCYQSRLLSYFGVFSSKMSNLIVCYHMLLMNFLQLLPTTLKLLQTLHLALATAGSVWMSPLWTMTL